MITRNRTDVWLVAVLLAANSSTCFGLVAPGAPPPVPTQAGWGRTATATPPRNGVLPVKQPNLTLAADSYAELSGGEARAHLDAKVNK